MEKLPVKPLEQKGQEKFKQDMVEFFDRHDDPEDRINAFLPMASKFVEAGILEESSLFEIKKCLAITNKDEFIHTALVVLAPLLQARIANPRLFESIRAEGFVAQGKFTKLNEILSYGQRGDIIHIHLAPSKELLKKIGKERYEELILDGLKKLAIVVEKDEGIKEITATSPVVYNNPKRMAKFHFVSRGLISEEHRERYWKGTKEPIEEAYIPRDKFLTQYLNK